MTFRSYGPASGTCFCDIDQTNVTVGRRRFLELNTGNRRWFDFQLWSTAKALTLTLRDSCQSENTVLASISFSILSRPPLPSQPVFESTSWSCVNLARRRENENGNVPVVIKACQIADWPHHIFDCYAYRGKTVPSAYHLSCACYCDLLPSKRRHSKVMGLIRISRPTIRWCYLVYTTACSNTLK